MKAWGAKKAAGLTWKQIKSEMTLENKTLDQLMRDLLADSCEYGRRCLDSEGREPDASTVGPPTNHDEVLSEGKLLQRLQSCVEAPSQLRLPFETTLFA